MLSQGNVVVRQKDDFHATASYWIAVNRAGEIVNELDDHLGKVVSRRGLACKEKRARCHVHVGIVTKTVVANDNPKGVQQLPLVFMDSLDLRVEDCLGVDDLACRSFQPISEAGFRLLFRCKEGGTEATILGKGFEFGQAP